MYIYVYIYICICILCIYINIYNTLRLFSKCSWFIKAIIVKNGSNLKSPVTVLKSNFFKSDVFVTSLIFMCYLYSDIPIIITAVTDLKNI